MVKSRKQLLNVLKRARKKIEKRKSWTKHANATDAKGIDVDPGSRQAARFCLRGAVLACAPDGSIYEGEFSPIAALERAIKLHTRGQLDIGLVPSVTNFNDRRWRTHKQVLKVLDEAIYAAGRHSL